MKSKSKKIKSKVCLLYINPWVIKSMCQTKWLDNFTASIKLLRRVCSRNRSVVAVASAKCWRGHNLIIRLVPCVSNLGTLKHQLYLSDCCCFSAILLKILSNTPINYSNSDSPMEFDKFILNPPKYALLFENTSK